MNLGFWGLGTVLGALIGGSLIILEVQTDPFDKASSYLVWLVGMSASSMLISFFRPERVWRWGLAVGLGFPVFVILDSIYGSRNYQLFPLTVIFSLIVGVISAFPGAYLGKSANRRFKELRSENNLK